MELLSEIFSPVQIPAWIAAVIYIASFQQQSSNKTIWLWIPADILMAVHFYFMSAPLLLMTAIGGTIRSLIALKCPRKTLLIYLLAYLAVIIPVFLFFGEGLQDYMVLIGTSFFCASVFAKEKFLWHRAFAFGHQLCWIIAFYLLGSYGGFALIIFMFISNITGTGRYVLANKNSRS